MASDRAASPGVLDLPILCEHYLGGSEDFLTALLHLMVPRLRRPGNSPQKALKRAAWRALARSSLSLL